MHTHWGRSSLTGHGTATRPSRCIHTQAAPGQKSTARTGVRRLRTPKPATLQPKPRPDDEEVEVPEVGWLWSAGQQSSSQQREQPTAQMTVADLRKDRIKAKRSLGQNFLTDDSILRDIVAAAGVRPDDIVLEIGPGTGNLTKHLLSAGAKVTAVEKDDTLYERLSEEYKEEGNLKLIHGDILRVNHTQLLEETLGRSDTERPDTNQPLEADLNSNSHSHSQSNDTGISQSAARPPSQKVKVVANLPYNITTDFLKAMMKQGELVSELHIMLQEEAGVRLVRSRPGDRDYRAMSIRVLLYSKPKYRFRIAKEKYYPAPNVDGALITFALLPPNMRPKVPSERAFLATVEKGFSERRKMLRNSLQPLFSGEEADAALSASGLPPGTRAQDLSLEQWVKLYKALHNCKLQAIEESATQAQTDATPTSTS